MRGTIVYIMAFLVFAASCVNDPDQVPFFEDDEYTISAYLDLNAEKYSMYIELLELSGFRSSFNAYGTYTLFIFDNDAFSDYLQANGKTSVSDLSPDEAKTLVRYHALNSEISSSNLGYGKLPAKNLEDDELVSEFDETGLQGIIINREAKITYRDIELSNGIVHVLDHALTPIIQSIVERLEDMGDYSIFLDLVKETGFYPILDRIYDTLDNEEIRRVYYTVFVETDEIYNAAGYANSDDLIASFDNGYTDHSDPLDSLNQFIANHIIFERALFTKDFESGNYQTYYGELMSFQVDLDYRINVSGPSEAQDFISFLQEGVDYQTKNGVFHTVNKVMNIFKPEPVEVIWGFYDQPFARDLDRVNGQDSDTYPNLDLFPNMTGSISGVNVHQPWSDYGYIDNHALVFVSPAWDVTVTMPMKIVKGRYKFYFYAKSGGGRATIQIFINDAPIGEPINLNGMGTWAVEEWYVGEVNLTETKANTIRMVTVGDGAGLLSHVRFEPV